LHASAAALADDLRRFVEGEPITARPLGAFRLAVRWANKYPIAAVSLIRVLLVLFAGEERAHEGTIFSGGSPIPIPIAGSFLAFVATIAILVRPRRWVVLVGLLCVLVDYGVLLGFFIARLPPNAAWYAVLLWLIPLGSSVLCAGILGGISRWLAHLYDADMLSIFFSGMAGGLVAGMVAGGIRWSSATANAIVDRLLPRDYTGGQSWMIVAGLAVLVGFGLGGWLEARKKAPSPG
jgi:hypothetical protein